MGGQAVPHGHTHSQQPTASKNQTLKSCEIMLIQSTLRYTLLNARNSDGDK